MAIAQARSSEEPLVEPFTLAEARAFGLTRKQLRSAAWRRIGPATYVRATTPDSPQLQIAAVAKRMPTGGAFAELTAIWLDDVDVTPNDPIELVVPPHVAVSARVGGRLRRAELPSCDVTRRHGYPITTTVRALADIAHHRPLVEAVVVTDQVLHAGKASLNELGAWTASHAGKKAVARFRRVISLADPRSESPFETRLRLILVLTGLPEPELQITLRDADGHSIGRADLYYPQRRLVIEYDGNVHRSSLVEDMRRQNRILGAGYRLLRFTAADVLGDPQRILTLVRAALAS